MQIANIRVAFIFKKGFRALFYSPIVFSTSFFFNFQDIVCEIPHCVPISAHHKWNYDSLLEKMWEYLALVRIYTKPKGQLPDYSSPVVLQTQRCSLEDFCNKIHRTILKEFKYALVWGTSVKHQPQKVGKDHVLNDEDVVQIVKKV